MDKVNLKKLPSVLKTTYQTHLPHKLIAEEEFRKSLKFNSIYKLYQRDQIEVRNSVSYELLKEQEKLAESERILKDVRRNAEKENINCKQQWNDLVKKEQALKELLIENEKFVTENEEKRARAHTKIAYEQNLQTMREADITQTKKEYKYLFEIKKKFESAIKKLNIYEDFMGTICSISKGQFKTVVDLIKRYQVLIDKRQEITSRRTRECEDLERSKTQLVTFIESQLLVLMQFNEKMIHLTQRHDLAKQKALRWEATLIDVRGQLQNKYSEMDGVTACIWNIYQQICGRRKIPLMKDTSQIDKQLNLINRAIFDATNFYKIAKKEIDNENYTNKNKSQKSRKRKISKRKTLADEIAENLRKSTDTTKSVHTESTDTKSILTRKSTESKMILTRKSTDTKSIHIRQSNKGDIVPRFSKLPEQAPKHINPNSL